MYKNEVIPAAEFIIKETILRYWGTHTRTLNGYASKFPTLLTKPVFGSLTDIEDFFYHNLLRIRKEGNLPEIYAADKDSANAIYPLELKNIIEAFEEVPQLSELPPFPVKYIMYISTINITPKLFPATHKFLISDLQDPRERQILKKRFSITSVKDINKCITNMEKTIISNTKEKETVKITLTDNPQDNFQLLMEKAFYVDCYERVFPEGKTEIRPIVPDIIDEATKVPTPEYYSDDKFKNLFAYFVFPSSKDDITSTQIYYSASLDINTAIPANKALWAAEQINCYIQNSQEYIRSVLSEKMGNISIRIKDNASGAEMLSSLILNHITTYRKQIHPLMNLAQIIQGEIHASPHSPYAHPIMPMPPKTFREIAEAQINLYESKNADYGDAADKLFDSYGLNYYLIMLEQKLLRIKNLNEKQDKANNESIEDSLLDMSNYAILAVESLRKNNSK